MIEFCLSQLPRASVATMVAIFQEDPRLPRGSVHSFVDYTNVITTLPNILSSQVLIYLQADCFL